MLTRHDETWTSGTHIVFRNNGTMNGSKGSQRKTNIYEVCEKGNVRSILGEIRWFGRWRKYTFNPFASCVFEETCLREIAQFIEEETKSHRAKKKAKTAKSKPCQHETWSVDGNCLNCNIHESLL